MIEDRETVRGNGQGIIQEMGTSLRSEGLIPAAIFNDPEIHRRELEQVFARAWCYVGHESEVAKRGDYVLRYIGEDAFVLVRDEENTIRVLFDACRHRGTQICRAEKGNASHFRCPYHGWTYKNTGELIGVPGYADAYKGMPRKDWGLHQASKVDSVHGFIFASLDPNAPSLDEYLGDMKFYLDLLFGLTEGGMEVIGEPHRWVVDANWKVGADNFAGDDYHTIFLHKSQFDIGAIQIPARENMKGYHVQVCNGHTITFSMDPDPNAGPPYFWAYPEEIVSQFKLDKLSKEQAELARRARVSVGTIFPNFSFLTFPATRDPKRLPPIPCMTVRQWQPRGPGQMELWSWVLAWKEAPEEFKRESYKTTMATFSTSGTFEQDDTEPWTSLTRNAGTVFARKRDFRLNYKMGMEGIGTSKPVSDFPGPGLAYYPRYEEGAQRSLWQRWHEYMTRD